MVFGHNMIPASRIDLEALRGVPPRGSDEWYIALLRRQFPGSWLPFGQEQVIRCAEPHFRVVSSVSGRLDYIETINRWNARVRAPSFRKRLLKLRLLPRWLISADFRLAFSSGVSANQVCFQRELLDHYRLVFENQKVWRDGKSRALHSARRAAVLPHADSGAHENACGRARYRCSRRRLSADTTLVRSSDRGERDRAAAMVLTIQIVATRSRGLSGPGDRDLAEAVAPARVVLR